MPNKAVAHDKTLGNTPLVITADQARVYQLRLGEARILIDGQQSRGAWWMGVFRQEPGFITPLHLHPRMDEHFFVLDGVLSLYLLNEWHHLEAGALAVVPHAIAHVQGNFGKLPVSTLALGRPAGFERFFVAQHAFMSRMPAHDPESLAELAKLVTRYDTQVLGSAPPVRSR
jgi:quercetin dioxygenase-like cupin family protein